MRYNAMEYLQYGGAAIAAKNAAIVWRRFFCVIPFQFQVAFGEDKIETDLGISVADMHKLTGDN